MNPSYDGNGNGNDDKCAFQEHVHIEEDDTSMGIVNDCNDAPSVNGLIQPGEFVHDLKSEATQRNDPDPSVANDAEVLVQSKDALKIESVIDSPRDAVVSTTVVLKDGSPPERDITEVTHESSRRQYEVGGSLLSTEDGISVMEGREAHIGIVDCTVPSYEGYGEPPADIDASKNPKNALGVGGFNRSGDTNADLLVSKSDITTEINLLANESADPIELQGPGCNSSRIPMPEKDHKSGDDQSGIDFYQLSRETSSENPVIIAKSSDSDEANEDDFASGAAATMAAVAAAASANTTSPSAAAEAARAMAPNLVPATISTRKEDITIVRLSAVKAQMLKRVDSVHKATQSHSDHGLDQRRDIVEQRLARSENDAFLQYLLLFQYFRIYEESHDPLEMVSSAVEPLGPGTNEGKSSGQSHVLTSSEKVRSMLHMAEEAYDAMEALLPALPSKVDYQRSLDDGESEFLDTPLVPDLLPPCTSVRGDATLQFFLACRGEGNEEQSDRPGVDLSPPKDDMASEPGTAVDASSNENDSIDLNVVPKSAASVFTSMFSSMTRTSKIPPARPSSSALAGVFRKRSHANDSILSEKEDDVPTRISSEGDLLPGEYAVSIDREMLGLTVENVLERTVVRTVLPGGAAKKAGAKIGSLIVKVGNVETKNLTHFETIDELRQSQRPLKLVLRHIAGDSLRSAREEMGRLIRGGGFGTSLASDLNGNAELEKRPAVQSFARALNGKLSKAEAFSQVLHQRWSKDGTLYVNKKEEALVQAGEKLVWILTLLVIGLEREASKAPSLASRESHPEGSPGKRSYASHAGEDYVEASKSVSKVLWDFVSYKLLAASSHQGDSGKPAEEFALGSPGNRGRRGPPPLPAGRFGARARALDHVTTKRTKDSNELLVRIGDVLHRTRTFLADPASPPAALVRGEVISFLCDILDIDTDMVLSEEEGGSSSAGIKAAPLNDLGAAGSLLKLIILNCSMMRSPGCTSLTNTRNDLDMEEEQRRRFGSLKKQLSGVDLHRFHAGNRFLAVVHRLAASRSVSARVTACSLGPVLWGHLDFPHQLQLRGVITRALHDVDVVVRKSTASVLHEIAELVFDPRAVPWLVLMCERAMTHPEPQLRAAAMTLTWHLSEHLPNAFLGDASEGSRSLRRLPPRSDPTFAEVYLLQCKLLPVATRLAEDRAPSVRLAVAAQCDRLCNSLGEHWYSVILDVLHALLGDMDENVRGEAILCVPRMAEIVLMTSTPERASVGVLEAFLPVLVKLLNDPSSNVRVALATAAGDLLTLLVGLQSLHEISPPSAHDQLSELTEKTNKKHVDDTLIPLLQNLLNDSEPEVTSAALRAVTNASRGNVREIRTRRNSRVVDDDTLSISSYQSHTSLERKDPVFIPVLSEEQVMRLLPTLTGLANSRQWRVRQGAVEIVPALLGCTSKLEIRSVVAQLCFRLMDDKVDAVRRTAAECLCLSGGGLGSHGEESAGEWVNAIVIPHVLHCSKSPDSKQRLLSLKMIEVIIANGICPARRRTLRQDSSDPPRLELLKIAISLSLDSVANVRLNFGRLVYSVVLLVDDEEVAALTNALNEQMNAEQERERGGDRDVLFFASQAITRSKEKDEVSLASLQVGSDR